MNNVIMKSFFVDASKIHPAQNRFSQTNVDEKIVKFEKEKRLIKNNHGGYDLGVNKKGKPIKTVLRKKKDALPVVNTPVGLLLLDGHHHVKASLQVGCSKIPVKIVEDCSSLNEDDFWKLAENRNWVHLTDISGKKVLPPKSFNSLVDDPNRYFAGIIAERKKKNSDYAVWLKNKNTPNFMEFKIADLMYQNDLVYSNDINKLILAEIVKDILVQNSDKLPGLVLA